MNFFDRGRGVFVVNRRIRHDDLRIVHFTGIHSLQVLPLFGFFFKNKNTNYIFFCRIFSTCLGILFTSNEWDTFGF